MVCCFSSLCTMLSYVYILYLVVSLSLYPLKPSTSHVSDCRVFSCWVLYFLPSLCHSTIISLFLTQSYITCSPIAVLATRVHFPMLQVEFVGPKRQQGFRWLHTVFTIIYPYLSLNTLMVWFWLWKHTQWKAMKYCTLRLRQFNVEHYTVCGKSCVQNCIHLWLHAGGWCWFFHFKFPFCFKDSE